MTSKRPPLEGISFTSTPGNAFRSSAAKLEARGSYVQTVQYSIVIMRIGFRVSGFGLRVSAGAAGYQRS